MQIAVYSATFGRSQQGTLECPLHHRRGLSVGKASCFYPAATFGAAVTTFVQTGLYLTGQANQIAELQLAISGAALLTRTRSITRDMPDSNQRLYIEFSRRSQEDGDITFYMKTQVGNANKPCPPWREIPVAPLVLQMHSH